MVEVVIGRIARPHGLRGELVVNLRTDEPEKRFAKKTKVRLENGLALEVSNFRRQGKYLIVKFNEIIDRNQADNLRGQLITIEVSENELPDNKDEFYDRNLIGLLVLDYNKEKVGKVTQVIHLPAQDLLVIETINGERLIPFVSALVPIVSITEKYLQLANVAGLINDEDN